MVSVVSAVRSHGKHSHDDGRLLDGAFRRLLHRLLDLVGELTEEQRDARHAAPALHRVLTKGAQPRRGTLGFALRPREPQVDAPARGLLLGHGLAQVAQQLGERAAHLG